MDYRIKTGDPSQQRTPCLVLGIFAKGKLTSAAEVVDQASDGALTKLLKRGDLTGDTEGQSLLLYDLPGVAAERILLVGCGDPDKLTTSLYQQIVNQAVTALMPTHSTEALCYLPELAVKERNLAERIRDAVFAAEEAAYRFDQLKTDPKPPKRPLKKLMFGLQDEADKKQAQQALHEAEAIAVGVKQAKDLGNLPGNVCTPSYLAEEAKKLAKDNEKLQVEILDQAQMEKLGMGALLSVAKGSRQPPRFIIMEYRGGKAKSKPVVLIGKGLTFDAGGISLKPAAAMDEMKYDMCGGASVFGAIAACLKLKLPLNVVGLVPSSENLPDGDANKPGDIVTSLSGQTIEILNTDAEGRLLLCDALTYSERFNPEVVVDMATLTGACIVALGSHASGLLTADDALADELLQAGTVSGDRAWRLPLWDDYQKQLDTKFADMANIGGKGAGAITAACFLARFAKKLRWAHLDIAGSAFLSGDQKGATGRPVPLLCQFLLQRCSQD